MSDPNDKKALLPARPAQAPIAKALMPVQPAQVAVTKALMPGQAPLAKALMPVLPVLEPVAVALMPCFPVLPEARCATALLPVPAAYAESPRPRSGRSSRAPSPSPVPRIEATLFASSAPKARAEKAVGAFDALGKISIQPDAAYRAEKRNKWLLAQETATAFRVTGCSAFALEEPRLFDLVVPLRDPERVVRSSAEIRELREQRGYRFGREVVMLGDVHGHRLVAHCDEKGVVAETVVQPEIPVHLFQSPDIPAWKSRVVSTDDSGSGGRRASGQDGIEIIRAIIEPNPELVKKLFAKQRPQRYADCNGTHETADQISQDLFNEINWADMDRADRCRDVVETIGPDDFARLWNLALECYTKPPPPLAVAEEEASSPETVVAPTA
ncbi:MAG: hypothetical protein WCO25_06055 [Candidatus Uhrbacteria bacterium]